MNQQQRELLIARICSGSIRVALAGGVYVIKRPSPSQLYQAHEVYDEHFRSAIEAGLYSEGELLQFLISNQLWNPADSPLLESLPKEIDQFKVALFKSMFKSTEKKTIRKFMAVARQKYAALANKRGVFDFLSCSGVASLARSKYLIGSSVYSHGKRLFKGSIWRHDSQQLEDIMSAYAKSRIDEGAFRELARNEPWRSIWVTNKVEKALFGIPAAEYTEDQRSLVCWSIFYDNIYSHPNCPSDEVINDDDIVDGWAIEQKRLRDAAMNASLGDDIVKNEKIRNSQEVYLVAETHEDARKIDGLNSEFGSVTKKQRFATLQNKGHVDELDMPDTAKRLRFEVIQKFSQTMNSL